MMNNLSEHVMEMINLIIMQLNFLLYFVHDVLDIKMIEQGTYVPKNESFSPQNILDFIKTIFLP